MKIKRLLDIKKISKSNNYNFSQLATSGEIELETKIQELTSLLETTHLTKDQIRHYQSRISQAFENAVFSENPIKPFEKLDQNHNLSREELLDGFEKLLSQNQIDSELGRKYIRKNAFQKIIVCLIATVLIAAGFAMIIMPAPPSFELFTIFYFNPNDGVTVMDLVSLLIILSGVFLFVLTFSKK
ncbi:hypothetical protein [Dyadobacter psychrotolerans]|uniref:Uncharacterized protein n=1 Tax=Dyadobacter psychrotolerans TaxID=2541721 RepID=A0A4R5DEQ3_9BACT|nr:hypothetical protein [Dyadobacter psychrotolerans]TDE10224.1 hypothetical protein E0F88_28430 [Dyadobacter psychrotolerans]